MKMLVLLIFIYRFNEIPNKTPSSYSVGTDKVIIKLMWEKKELGSQHYTEKEKKKVERRMITKFKIFYKAAEIMTGGVV